MSLYTQLANASPDNDRERRLRELAQLLNLNLNDQLRADMSMMPAMPPGPHLMGTVGVHYLTHQLATLKATTLTLGGIR